MNRVIVFAYGLLAATIVASAEQDRRVRDHDVNWVAPARADEKMNPLINRPATAAGGRRIFQDRCSTCHGDNARGTSRAPDLTARAVQTQSDGALFWKITNGNTRTDMPTFSFLPELQRWQLVLHLRAHATSAEKANSANGGHTPNSKGAVRSPRRLGHCCGFLIAAWNCSDWKRGTTTRRLNSSRL